MVWTLYKTRSPEASADYPEFYELSLKTRRGAGKIEHYIVIIHGWWDDLEKGIKQEVTILNADPGEGFPNYADAVRQYLVQKQHFARNGFVHAFTTEIPSGESLYEFVAPK